MYELIKSQRTIKTEAFVDALDVVRPIDFVFQGEMHDFWEAVFVSNGKAVASAEDRIYNLHAGQLLFHKPMEFHRIRSAENSSPHLKIISFSALGEGMKFFDKKCFELDENEIFEYERVFEAIKKECGENSDTNFTTASVLLDGFLVSLTSKKEDEKRVPTGDEQRYKEIVNTLKEHSEEWLTLEDIAKMLNMSVSNMKRIFSKYSDKGVAGFFMTVKVRRAIQLLKLNKNCSQIAEQLGFSSVNYFHTVFKRETGLTPGEYKKMYISM